MTMHSGLANSGEPNVVRERESVAAPRMSVNQPCSPVSRVQRGSQTRLVSIISMQHDSRGPSAHSLPLGQGRCRLYTPLLTSRIGTYLLSA